MSYLKRGVVVDGRWAVGPVIGAGGFGVVYRVTDVTTGEPAALKTLRREGFQDEMLVKRLLREARVCSELESPHTARLLAVGDLLGQEGRSLPYMAFELVRGLSLAAILDVRGSLSERETARILHDVLVSLTEAHGRGVLHRDMKPGNIMCVAPEDRLRPLGRGPDVDDVLGVPAATDALWRDLVPLQVKVLDFGLAKLLPRDKPVTRLTEPGMGAGTAEYMSPEQAEGQGDLDARSDIYSVGMLIFRFLVGHAPHLGETAVDVALKHLLENLPSLPRPFNAHPLARVYDRAGQRERTRRFPNATAMAAALEPIAWPERDASESSALLYLENAPARPGFFARLFGRR